jgi:hypothetical protein
MTSPADLSSLKQEVADLWRRFKTEEPSNRPEHDPLRQQLVEKTRTLDLRQKELMVRRDALRHELELEHARTSGRLPVFRGLGLFVGLLVGAVVAGVQLEALAGLTDGLPSFYGALMLVAVVPFPLLIPRLRR